MGNERPTTETKSAISKHTHKLETSSIVQAFSHLMRSSNLMGSSLFGKGIDGRAHGISRRIFFVVLCSQKGPFVNIKVSKHSFFHVWNISHTVPENDNTAQNTTDTGKDQGNNTPGSETSRKIFGLDVLTGQVEVVLVVASSITGVGHIDIFTDLLPVVGQSLVSLDSKRVLNQSESQTLGQMPFNVAVEKPNTWIVGLESDHKVRVWVHVKNVSSHWVLRRSIWGRFVVRLRSIVRERWTSLDNLEHVTVQVERMLTGILVVEHNFDNFVLLKDKSVGVSTVDVGIGSVLAGRQDSSKSRHLWSMVADVVEESIVDTVVQVVHHNVDGNLVVVVLVQLFFLQRNQKEVVKEVVNRVDHVLSWQISIFVVDDIIGSVKH
ncbi:hypothetical protein OGATHE_004447 [Ogataea polymorpha]|uniref:Uncharacterized protein n=1 Tax=Ogataea polymorpha TaxID=460523 RepID=A0A9P8T2L3_9ASCO|nr:hypothetical protein OGATHE_004447 [Ogataea polymorpha]